MADFDKPTSQLVFKLIRIILEVFVGFIAVVAPVVNDNFDSISFNLHLNILFVMLETKLKRQSITDIIPSINWFMNRSYLAIF